jgi:hypothetical protein
MRVEGDGVIAGMVVVVVGLGIRRCEWAKQLGAKISKLSRSRLVLGTLQQGVVIEGGGGMVKISWWWRWGYAFANAKRGRGAADVAATAAVTAAL